jgi:hypothetical protein
MPLSELVARSESHPDRVIGRLVGVIFPLAHLWGMKKAVQADRRFLAQDTLFDIYPLRI